MIMEYSQFCHSRLQSTNYESISEYATLVIIYKSFTLLILEYKQYTIYQYLSNISQIIDKASIDVISRYKPEPEPR